MVHVVDDCPDRQPDGSCGCPKGVHDWPVKIAPGVVEDAARRAVGKVLPVRGPDGQIIDGAEAVTRLEPDGLATTIKFPPGGIPPELAEGMSWRLPDDVHLTPWQDQLLAGIYEGKDLQVSMARAVMAGRIADRRRADQLAIVAGLMADWPVHVIAPGGDRWCVTMTGLGVPLWVPLTDPPARPVQVIYDEVFRMEDR